MLSRESRRCARITVLNRQIEVGSYPEHNAEYAMKLGDTEDLS